MKSIELIKSINVLRELLPSKSMCDIASANELDYNFLLALLNPSNESYSCYEIWKECCLKRNEIIHRYDCDSCILYTTDDKGNRKDCFRHSFNFTDNRIELEKAFKTVYEIYKERNDE